MHHVVARLVGERDVRDVDVPARACRGCPLRVRHAHERQLCLRDDHAERYVHVHHVHHATPQPALGSAGGFPIPPVVRRVGEGFRSVGSSGVRENVGIQRLLDGQALVHEGQLHVLAGAEVRSAEHHRVAAVHERPQAAVQLVGVSRHLHALDRQLVVYLPAHAHDGHVRGPLAVAEAHAGGLGVEALERDARPLRPSRQVVVGMRHVVEERARLHQHRKGAGAHVVAERGGGFVQVGQKHVRAALAQAAVQPLQHVAQRGVRLGGPLELLTRAGERGPRGRELHDGVHVGAGQRGDGLPGGWHDAADLVQLVAEEVEPHRVHQVAGEHVQGAAAHGERAGAVQLSGVLVAALLQGPRHVPELGYARRLRALHVRQLAAGLEHKRQVHVRPRRRQRAHERAGARHHHGLAAGGQRMHGLHAARCLGRVARLAAPRVVGALGEAHDALVAQVRRHLARERDGRVLARHHDERRLRLVREPRRHEERPRRRGHAERAVMPLVELAPERVEATRFLQGERQ